LGPTYAKKRDYLAGGLVTLLGVGVTFNSLTYSLGTLVHMGPGMFPMILGTALTFVGILILGTAVTGAPSENEHPLLDRQEWFAWACILAGPILFIILGKLFGLVAASFACVFVPALGDRTATLKSSVTLAAGVTLFGVLLFSCLLKMPLPLFQIDF
jgi:uncharacterized membrane protein YhdT